MQYSGDVLSFGMVAQPPVYYLWHWTCGGFAIRGSFIHSLATFVELSNVILTFVRFVSVFVQTGMEVAGYERY